LGVALLTAGFVCGGFVTRPSSAFASADAGAPPATAVGHTVTFESNGSMTQQLSYAATVGDFLHERNVVVGERDYVYPAIDVPLSDGIVVTYRAAVPVVIQTARLRIATLSSAEDIGALLEEQHVRLGSDDEVTPSLADAVPSNGLVRVTRIVTWERNRMRVISAQTIHRLDFSMTPGTTRVISTGSSGQSEDVVRFSQRDGGTVRKSIVSSHVLRKARPRIVIDGVDEYEAFSRIEMTGVNRTLYQTESALEMVATAYTAGCAGCSGMTATGRPAGHGIVAVDPSVIPLGTRLFIPGYGLAIAGDTGGAIHGYRIDLGFNSQRDAILFGRREVTVYRLK
jgi:3D (Asp-Asp-Asp) domain-containing protein